MPITKRGAKPLADIILALAAAFALTASPARADQVVQISAPPIVVIKSASGLVTVTRGGDGAVRVVGADGASATTFQLSPDNQGRIGLPAGMGLPSRRFTLPGIQPASIGVRVDNPGGDITVYLPQHIAAVLVRATTGDVAVSQIRGPYVMIADNGNVDVTRVFGFGNVRTSTGHVTLTGVGGNLHVETTFGTVTGLAMFPERADIKTQGGDIIWSALKLGAGPYRFTSGAGNVRVGLSRGLSANIDAQSTSGSVLNRFGQTANVRFRSAHALSIMLGGGGPEITAASESGKVDIGPPMLRKP
jgi:hypothetical protein